MKNIKIIFLCASITFFASIPFSVEAAERDCSDPKGFHEKMMCKIEQGKDFTGTSSTETSSTGTSSEGSEKKTLFDSGIWKKIKTFGGKNVGEEG